MRAIDCDCEETECPESEDGQHCEHWYDGEECCNCGAEECLHLVSDGFFEDEEDFFDDEEDFLDEEDEEDDE